MLSSALVVQASIEKFGQKGDVIFCCATRGMGLTLEPRGGTVYSAGKPLLCAFFSQCTIEGLTSSRELLY